MRYFTNLFLRIEERARSKFERIPFVHAFLAGVGMVLFWRGIWETADFFNMNTVASIVIGGLLLGAIGLFLQTFVGNTIIIKQVERDKQLARKAEREIKEVQSEVTVEEVTMTALAEKLDAIERKLESLTKK